MIAGLEARLAQLAASGQTITYGALARDLGLAGPGMIARLTQGLEMLMEQDAKTGAPLRAALCVGRLNGDVPAIGFFDKAAALGCIGLNDPASFVVLERKRLFAQHNICA